VVGRVANNLLFGNAMGNLQLPRSLESLTNLELADASAAGVVSAEDLHLGPSSPARGAGTDLTAMGYAVDLDGRLRASPPSIGAYELASDSPDAGVPLDAAVLTPTSDAGVAGADAAGASEDTGTRLDGGAGVAASSGCGCRVSPRAALALGRRAPCARARARAATLATQPPPVLATRMNIDLRVRFVAATTEEDPALGAALAGLDERGSRELSGVLERLVGPHAHELDARARLFARRLLGPLRHRDAESLGLLNKALDYLDLDTNGRLDEEEIELAARCLEAFAALTPPELELSKPELRTLSSLLRALDANDDHRLDAGERQQLLEGIGDLRAFLAQLRETSSRFLAEV
jgi:hypothetical protein